MVELLSREENEPSAAPVVHRPGTASTPQSTGKTASVKEPSAED